MRCIHYGSEPGRRDKKEEDKESSANMIATFGNNLTVDASDTKLIGWMTANGATLKDFKFDSLPKVGQGIVMMHKCKLELDQYHMHFAAVLATWGNPVSHGLTISKMAEPPSGNACWRQLDTEVITSVDQWRTRWFPGEEADYAIGMIEIGMVSKPAPTTSSSVPTRRKSISNRI